MTRKIKDLEQFMDYVRKQGYTTKIGLHQLEYFIADKFGYSSFTLKTTKNALVRFNFIMDDNNGIFRIVNKVKPERALEEEAEEFLDKHLNT